MNERMTASRDFEPPALGAVGFILVPFSCIRK